MLWKNKAPMSSVAPWRKITEHAVGGLFQVGYAENSDLLLVLSSSGRGIFNCLTGEKIARDNSNVFDHFNTTKLLAKGFADLDHHLIRMAGLYGGGLPFSTKDGWFLNGNMKTDEVFLTKAATAKEAKYVKVGEAKICELRAFGFSETGSSFIIATSCSLIIFAR